MVTQGRMGLDRSRNRELARDACVAWLFLFIVMHVKREVLGLEYQIQWAVEYEDKIRREAEKKGLPEPTLHFVGILDDEKREIVSELNRISKFMGIIIKHLTILKELLKTDVAFEIWIGDFFLQMYCEPSGSYDFTIYAIGLQRKLEVGKIVFSSIPSISY